MKDFLRQFFFDTYALFEVIAGNPAYKSYGSGLGMITSHLNLMELYYGLLKPRGHATALYYFNYFMKKAIPVEPSVIPPAMDFRFEHRKLDLSYTDAIGYQLAKNYGILFLTGDKGFEGLPNVEFVK